MLNVVILCSADLVSASCCLIGEPNHYNQECLLLSFNVANCRLVEWVKFLHEEVMATVIMCGVRNPACTSKSALGKERYING